MHRYQKKSQPENRNVEVQFTAKPEGNDTPAGAIAKARSTFEDKLKAAKITPVWMEANGAKTVLQISSDQAQAVRNLVHEYELGRAHIVETPLTEEKPALICMPSLEPENRFSFPPEDLPRHW